jgi:ribosomal protein S12 methylthiotransferase accessory factor
MAGFPRPLRDGSTETLARALGVTRVARLTGLDVTGVEVASAVRPGGHVLSVTNGKGTTFREAARGALSEAAELWAAERPSVAAVGPAADVAGAIGPQGLDGAEPTTDGAALAWAEGVDLASGRRARVPAHAVFCPAPGAALPGPATVRWTSNGIGAHPSVEAAALHGLLEVVERDRLARALPEGFTLREVRARGLARSGWPREVAALAAPMEARGLRVLLLDLGGADDRIGLPCAAALLLDRPGGPVPAAAGYACRPSPDEALRAALLEAAQSRATEIHGAREDVLGSPRPSPGAIAALARAPLARRVTAMPRLRPARDGAALAAVAWRVARFTGRPVVAVELSAPGGLAVVKVVAPGLLRSALV